MFCPHCHNKIPDGSNICPLCYSNLAGVKPQQTREEPAANPEAAPQRTAAQPRAKKNAYTKGSRGSKRSADRTPMIIAFGLIVILLVIIVMIVRSMFGAGQDNAMPSNTAAPQVTVSPGQNFVVFGSTPTPNPAQLMTVTPNLEITPTPAPQQTSSVSYNTLRKNDQGPEVVMLQQALAELGYLSGAADGIYGTATMTAVKNFQKDHELDDDGIAGKMTLEALYSIVQVTPIPDVTAGPGDIMDLPG